MTRLFIRQHFKKAQKFLCYNKWTAFPWQQTPSEASTKEIFDLIGKALKLPSEDKIPFKYLCLVEDFNGIDIHQYSDRIVFTCETY